MKPRPQNAFQRRYHAFDAIWADCCMGYEFVEFERRSPTKDAVLAWFREHETVQVFGVADCSPERLRIEEHALREVPEEQAIPLIEAMVQQAVRYGSNESLPSGEALQLARLFLNEFEAPLVLTNFCLSQARGGSYIGSLSRVISGYGYSCEALLCCVDQTRMGFMLSIENE